MRILSRRLCLIAACAALAVPGAAQAQRYAAGSPPPLYPYELQPGQPYAVQVAPGTYVIHRQNGGRNYPYVAPAAPRRAAPAPAPKRFSRPVQPNDTKLIEELRRRHARNAPKNRVETLPNGVKREIINTTQIVRGPPVVIERRRVVEDPPRVIERYVSEPQPEGVVEVPPPRGRAQRADRVKSARNDVEVDARGVLPPPGRGGKDDKRVIRADAEVTILGPDRMSIRLFRKGEGGAAR